MYTKFKRLCVYLLREMINASTKLISLAASETSLGESRKSILLPALHLDTEQHTALLISAWGSQHLNLPVREMQHYFHK